jgi:hypothetical protein
LMLQAPRSETLAITLSSKIWLMVLTGKPMKWLHDEVVIDFKYNF